MTTFAPVLAELLRTEPGRPLVTYYDHATGERVELSVTTYANWVAKTASLLVEEYDLERGQGLHVDLPTHWLGPVFLGAAWTVGLVVTTPEAADAIVSSWAATVLASRCAEGSTSAAFVSVGWTVSLSCRVPAATEADPVTSRPEPSCRVSSPSASAAEPLRAVRSPPARRRPTPRSRASRSTT